jgi:hypothetical protein
MHYTEWRLKNTLPNIIILLKSMSFFEIGYLCITYVF